jgi:hypothetical protein
VDFATVVQSADLSEAITRKLGRIGTGNQTGRPIKA